ncbi:sugar kinase [Govanella unica]|uniref:Sugar kinase n=1 Tax=Govanella unica TaxID=2975056 RepID=A0A9X3Z610_9PROT|nr:sugar kinase [Govania unica]MDA5192690.1 sugar kinase [Govania unica]
MTVIVGFGEMLLRLKSPGAERFFQSPQLEATFGGAEFNVLASLSHFGYDTRLVTALPAQSIGAAARTELQRHGIAPGFVVAAPGRMGLYYYEAGSNLRGAQVIYDREGSAFATAAAGVYSWSGVLDGADWFHVTGISAAVSASSAKAMTESMAQAADKNIPVSLDLNYRKHLWDRAGRDAASVMVPLLDHVTVLFAGVDDAVACLDIAPPPEGTALEQFRTVAQQLMARHPRLAVVVATFREARSADDQSIWAAAYDGTDLLVTEPLVLRDIVDRIGAGDAFVAGYLHGTFCGRSILERLAFALSADALKHSIPGDVNLVTIPEVKAVMHGHDPGRVKR